MASSFMPPTFVPFERGGNLRHGAEEPLLERIPTDRFANVYDPVNLMTASPVEDDPQSASGQDDHGQDGGGNPRIAGPSSNPPGRISRFDPSSGDSRSLVNRGVLVFMPYVHFETDNERLVMHNAVEEFLPQYREAKRANATVPLTGPPPQEGLDKLLLRAYLASFPTCLHIRRTLDQYFHKSIDTKERDSDQVVYRWQTKKTKRPSENPHVLMIDQMWMWILGDDLIVTSFPRQWGAMDASRHKACDDFDVLASIVEHFDSNYHERVHDISQLAMVIARSCSTALSSHCISNDELQPLHIFEASIGRAMQDETKRFESFKKSSENISRWLLSPPDHRHRQRKDMDHEISVMLDIGEEMKLVEEIKDIRDELEMLEMVLSHQYQVVCDMARTFTGCCGSREFEPYLRTIVHPLQETHRMQRQADRLYDSINHLLDLKQKHAGAIEARFAREQADDAAAQGQTVLVFTIVTVIFLPLSFIAAFFAIDISELPHNADNAMEMSLGYASRYVFGVGLSVAGSCVIVVLFIANRVAVARYLMAVSDYMFPSNAIEGDGEKGRVHPPGTEEKTNTTSFATSFARSRLARRQHSSRSHLDDGKAELGEANG